MKYFFSALIYVLNSGFSVEAQSSLYSVRYFSEDDGLFGRTIRTVAQDSTGLIWIGTSEGIYTFDGEEFSSWEDTSTFASHLNIIHFTTTSTGDFHLQTMQGKTARFNPYERTVTPVILKNSPQDTREYHPLLHQKNGEINFLYDDIKRVYIRRESSIKRITGLTDSTINIQQNLTAWGTLLHNNIETKLLSEFDETGRRIRKLDYSFIKEPGVTFLLSGANYQKISFAGYQKPLNELYEYDEEGHVSKFELFDENQEKLSLMPEGRVPNAVCIVRDSFKNYWIATDNTLFVLDKNKRLIKDLSPQLKRLNEKSWATNELFIDDQQRVWLSTAQGLFLISPKNNPFTLYLNKETNPSLRGIIKVSETELLVGTYLKPRIINLITGKDISLKNENYFLGITRGPDGDYYTGHHGPALSALSPPLIESLVPRVVGTKIPEIVNLSTPYYDAPTEIMFCGTSRGLYVRDSTGLFAPYSGPGEDYFLNQKSIEYFRRDSNGLQFCADNGIYRFSLEKGVEQVFTYNNISFKHFHISPSGIYWIATKGGGLIRWDPSTNETKQYTKKNGLSDNVLYAVYEDDFGRLWLPSNRGLMLFIPQTESIRVFTTDDGIAHNEFNTFSHFQDGDGRIYFGGIDGLTAFYPSDIREEETNYPFRLTVLNQFNGSKNEVENVLHGFQKNKELVLQPSDKFFNLQFALQDYASSNTEYAWKLEPSDQEWTYQSDNSIRINGLSYGKHLLTIRGRGQGKDWNKETIEIPIYAKRPFYLRWYFQALAALFSALMVWVYIRRRTTRLEQEKQNLRHMVDERTEELVGKNKELQEVNNFKDRLFALISHDLRAPVISLRGLTRKVRYLVDNKRFDEVNHLAGTVDSAVRSTQNLLDNLLAWAISQNHEFPYHPELLDLQNILVNNDQFFRSVAEQKNISLNTNVSESVMAFADATAVATIIRNLTDNAIKFTPSGGSVSLEATANEMLATISVRDQGAGIAPENIEKIFKLGHPDKGTGGEKGVGLGLTLSKELAMSNQGSLTLSQNGPDGATFTLSLPLNG